MATNKSIEALNIYPVKHEVKESSLQTNDTTMTSYINKLTIFERTIFSLIYFRGFDVNEITSLLQLPAKIIKKRFKLLHKF
jgi:DNA-directed RNA polymerase specialized sigma24 family protein